ncbi:GtrA-like protein [compost metagenome]
MNLMFVFKHSRHSIKSIARFLAGFAAAYLINIAVLEFFTKKIGMAAEIAQILAMASYTITFYLINKHLIWKIK